MSLDNNTKRQLDDIVNAIDDRIETAIDNREIEAKKNISHMLQTLLTQSQERMERNSRCVQ